MVEMPERIHASLRGPTVRNDDGRRQMVGGWSENPARPGATEYVRADLYDELEAENERLTKALSEQIDRDISGIFPAEALSRTGAAKEVEALPRRIEKISGQSFSYVKLGDVLAVLSALEPAAPAEPDFASTIAAVIKDECDSGAAAGWRSCTGCHETNEGYETGRYPYSKMFGCYVGHGCSECGGLGVAWEYWSESALETMARDEDPAAPGGRQEPVTDALVERMCRTPVIEALTPTGGEWQRCVSVQDTYDLMKRRIRKGMAILKAAMEAGR